MCVYWNSSILLLIASGLSCGQTCGDFSGDGKFKAGEGQISCHESEGTVTWTVTRPEVKRRITEYPEIEFHAGDIVTVSAGGCVDTGGAGKTLKQYVGPWGIDTDRLYHGLIWIPGAKVIDGDRHLIVPVGTSLVRLASITAGPNGTPPAQHLVVEKDFPEGVSHSLHLGYEDDEYDDNSYPPIGQPHGERKGNNCSADPKDYAYVTIAITRGTAVGPSTLGPLDPVANEYDPNGFQLSPAWFWNYPANPPHDKPRQQTPPDKVNVLNTCNNFRYINPLLVHEGVEHSCTRQVSFDQPSSLSQCLLEPGFGEFHGHVNWAPATYYGRLTFEEFSTDNDLDFDLFDFLPNDSASRFASWYPPGWWDKGQTVNPILTKDSQISAEYLGNLHLEFGGYEVTEFFSRPGPPKSPNQPKSEDIGGWHMFRYEYAKDPVARGNKLQQWIDGKTASVTGLLNLDCVHECHTELHPIQAMAVRTRREDCAPGAAFYEIPPPGVKGEKAAEVKCDTGALDARTDDSWLIFARNSGNEGSCSLDQHWVDRDVMRIFLPAPAGAKLDVPKVRGEPAEIFYSNFPGLKWRIDPDEHRPGVILTLFLKPDGCVASAPASGANIRVHGALHLNWMSEDESSAQLKFDTVGDIEPGQSAAKSLPAYDFHARSHDRQATKESILKGLAEPEFFDLEPVTLAEKRETAPAACKIEEVRTPSGEVRPPSDDLVSSRIVHEARDAEDQVMRQRVLIKPVSLFSKETFRNLFTDYVKANVGVFWQNLKLPASANMPVGGGSAAATISDLRLAAPPFVAASATAAKARRRCRTSRSARD